MGLDIGAALDKEGDCADMWKHFEDQINGA